MSAATGAPLAWIALGSNLDGPLDQLRRAHAAIARFATVRARSALYRTVPVGGPAGQDDYLNAVIGLRPPDAVEPGDLLVALLDIERAQGRRRRERWGPRTLDLDLLAVGDAVLDTPALRLPHPRMMGRAFVLVPLCEVAPRWSHPASGERACDALGRLDDAARDGVQRTGLHWDAR